jgi:hypothetical protein
MESRTIVDGTTLRPWPAQLGGRTGSIPRPNGQLRAAYLLSGAIAVLMVVAAALGLFVDGLYREGAWAREALRGGDLVTLVLAAPVLMVALALSVRGSKRAQPVWVGMLAYAVYTYAYFAFGSAFNDVFLLHIALLAMSVFALACALPNLDVPAIAARLRGGSAARWVGVVLVAVGVLQGALWAFLILRFAVTGEVMQDIPVAGQHLVFALDLSLLVPSLVLAGVLLFRRTAMGHVLGAAMAVMGSVYLLNLLAAGVFQANADVAGVKAFPPEGIAMTVGLLIASAVLLRGRRMAPRSDRLAAE